MYNTSSNYNIVLRTNKEIILFQVIVMACNEQEARKHKCECYWTPDDQGEKQFGKFFVSLLKAREICPDFLVRTMRLQWAGEDGVQVMGL